MKILLVGLCLFLVVVAKPLNNELEDEEFRRTYEIYQRALQAQIPQRQSPLDGVNSRVLAMLKKECDRQAPDAFQKFKVAMEDLHVCIKSATSQMVPPRTRGDAGIVQSICGVSQPMVSCFHKYMEGAKPCLSDEEKEGIPDVNKMTGNLVDYLCVEEGKRVITFIEEGGATCVQEKANRMQQCVNSTLLFDMTSDETSLYKMDKPEKCKRMNGLQSCFKGTLEECSRPTAATFVEGLMTIVKEFVCTN